MDKKDVEKCSSSRGKTLYLKFLSGERLSASQAIIAKCFECMCGFDSGRVSCEVSGCALFNFMPYNKEKKKSRKITEEQKKKMRDGRKKRNFIVV